MKAAKYIIVALIALLITSFISLGVFAEKVDFEYKIKAIDESGYEVTNLRGLPAGSKLTIEVEISRNDIPDPSYMVYGLELRLHDLGLRYNNDGACFRNGTDVRELKYSSGDSVGFAYYDMQQVGESVNNPVLGATWSYTVENPAAVNLKVPVAIMYVPDDGHGHEIIGNSYFKLDPKGGVIEGGDPSGEYPSGTVIVLPTATFGDYLFVGWTDGATTYPAGSEYVVSGYTTLEAVWEVVEKDRQIRFDPDYGVIDGEDPSGMYKDGDVIVIPGATRDGYTLVCWSDGVNEYQPGDEYTVYNSVVIKAQWKLGGEDTTPATGDEPEPHGPTKHNIWPALGIICGALLLGLGIWWFIILWKRRWVLYSLKTGDIALSFKDKDHNPQVRVVALDDDRHVVLGTSGRVEAGKRLRFIKGTGEIADIEKGKYKGRLLVQDGEFKDIIKVRVKVLDREIRERKND